MLVRLIGSALAALFLLGCGNLGINVIRGSGTVKTETRSVSGFHAVTLSGVGDLAITQGVLNLLTERMSSQQGETHLLNSANLFEAARWAPSCYNEQPWRFVYATEPEDRARLAVFFDDDVRGAEIRERGSVAGGGGAVQHHGLRCSRLIRGQETAPQFDTHAEHFEVRLAHGERRFIERRHIGVRDVRVDIGHFLGSPGGRTLCQIPPKTRGRMGRRVNVALAAV